jgi:tetratricopeptide (TPR) repeat protein
VLAPLLGVIIILASIRSFTYARLWNDPVDLYRISLQRNPGSIRLYFVLSEELVRRGKLEEAADALARARHVMPDYAVVWYRSALLSLRQGRFEEAEIFAREAQTLDPRVTNNDVWDYIRERKVLTE